MKSKKKKVKYYLGLDVHKKFTEYVVRDKEGNTLIEERCASIPRDVKEVLNSYFYFSIIALEPNFRSSGSWNYFSSL